MVYILYIHYKPLQADLQDGDQERKRREWDTGYLFHANAFRKFDLVERQAQADNIVLSHPFQYTQIIST